jgi:hypothetical protein
VSSHGRGGEGIVETGLDALDQEKEGMDLERS